MGGYNYALEELKSYTDSRGVVTDTIFKEIATLVDELNMPVKTREFCLGTDEYVANTYYDSQGNEYILTYQLATPYAKDIELLTYSFEMT